jgi:hypothetical protein
VDNAFSFQELTTLTFTACTLTQNVAQGGAGASGGTGGNGLGGALYLDTSLLGSTTVAVSNCSVALNATTGGDGTTGGNGLGGGIYAGTGDTVNLTRSSIVHNFADGGDGEGGSDGQGVGGGVYNLGTFTVDAASIIAHNHASTSNDDTFGV